MDDDKSLTLSRCTCTTGIAYMGAHHAEGCPDYPGWADPGGSGEAPKIGFMSTEERNALWDNMREANEVTNEIIEHVRSAHSHEYVPPKERERIEEACHLCSLLKKLDEVKENYFTLRGISAQDTELAKAVRDLLELRMNLAVANPSDVMAAWNRVAKLAGWKGSEE